MARYLKRYIVITGLVVIGLFSGFTYYESHHSTERINWGDTSNEAEPTKTLNAETNTEPIKLPPIQNEELNEVTTFVNYDVPFTSQAPTGNWDDERQQDGCEETSALMAMLWVRNKTITAKQAETEIMNKQLTVSFEIFL